MDPVLFDLVLDRLDNTSPGREVEDLVLGACDGPGAVSAVLGGAATSRPTRTAPSAADAEPAGAFLTSVTVEAFRGIGKPLTLDLQPGPGLTLVVGRNGSGKSSLAEALEVLFTGSNARWEGRAKVWVEGWRNLHHDGKPTVRATLAEEGVSGTTTAEASWDDDAEVADAEVWVQRAGAPRQPLTALGWEAPLEMWRPFLSYNELSSMLDEGPSKLYDTMARILGLDDLVEAAELLRQERLARKKVADAQASETKRVLGVLSSVDDDRARKAATLLSTKTVDLDAVRELVAGDRFGSPDDELSTLKSLAQLRGPDAPEAGEASAELRTAAAEVERMSATDAGRARELAELLSQALRHHIEHGDTPCPVCGAGQLDGDWRTRTQAEVDRLRAEAREAQDAEKRLKAAVESARRLAVPLPEVVVSGEEVGVDCGELIAAWTIFAEAPSGPIALAAHLEEHVPRVATAAVAVRDAAQSELERRQDVWRPVATQLAAWLEHEVEANRAAADVKRLKAAEDWLKDATGVVRDERFAPIADRCQHVWEQLRQQSNVELGKVALTGEATRRRVELDVTVDGVAGAALSVMSQGELHALALSLFLPRATMAESPFRFVVIDDPVQAMDPARVEGLAAVLDEVAKTRQVIVFTHDDRLPEAVRRLQLPARVVEVTRRSDSLVELRPGATPAQRAIDDAMALAQGVKSGSVPPEVGRRVIPGFCRLAVEGACADVVRRRRLARGELHAEVEDLLEKHTKLYPRLMLAVFDDPSRSKPAEEIERRFGKSKAETCRSLNQGSHQGLDGQPDYFVGLVRNTEHLVNEVAGLS